MRLLLLVMHESELGRVDWVDFDVHVMQRIKLQNISKWQMRLCELIVFR